MEAPRVSDTQSGLVFRAVRFRIWSTIGCKREGLRFRVLDFLVASSGFQRRKEKTVIPALRSKVPVSAVSCNAGRLDSLEIPKKISVTYVVYKK